MPRTITRDDVDRLFEHALRPEQTSAVLARAQALQSWATDAASFTLSDAVSPARLLLLAADDFVAAGERDRAFAVAGQAQLLLDAGSFDAHPTLVALHLDAGRAAEATAVADEARAAAASDPVLAEQIGDAFELADEFALAQRWYTLGVRALEKAGLTRSDFYLRLLADRYRVRRDGGMPLDVLDVETDELRRRAEEDVRERRDREPGAGR